MAVCNKKTLSKWGIFGMLDAKGLGRPMSLITGKIMSPKKTAKAKTKNGNNGASLGIEAELWQAADKLRVMVKRVLRKHGYPPDKQEQATQTVLEQAEVIARDWAG
ncbi:MAG: DUF3387 domain-containing protein [Anaerolineales bacterium]|nr:DUF3387 domain-containing protein [Anaerolineales bacterium]